MHVDGCHVAHLSRAAARRYQSAILALKQGGRQLVVDAQLVGYAERNVGVFLQLPAAEQLDRVA